MQKGQLIARHIEMWFFGISAILSTLYSDQILNVPCSVLRHTNAGLMFPTVFYDIKSAACVKTVSFDVQQEAHLLCDGRH